MEMFELQRRHVAQRGVAPAGVVPPFSELEPGRLRLGVRRQRLAVEQLALQRREEALGHRVVEAIATEPIDAATPHSRHRAPKASDVYWQPWSE